MRWQVREGFGAMPAFSERIINDEELDNLISYLNYLQSLDPPGFAREAYGASSRPETDRGETKDRVQPVGQAVP